MEGVEETTTAGNTKTKKPKKKSKSKTTKAMSGQHDNNIESDVPSRGQNRVMYMIENGGTKPKDTPEPNKINIETESCANG